MIWPLLNIEPSMPGAEGSFGVIRKYDIHTGIDLYCPIDTPIVAIEAGIVIGVIPFTGPEADSPWWESTEAIIVRGKSGIIVYGEVNSLVKEGDSLEEGALIGKVLTVLKKDKGKPISMLHLELYDSNFTEVVWWKLNENKPETLKDPTFLLESIYK